MTKYESYLKKQYYEITHDNEKDIFYIKKWYQSRKNIYTNSMNFILSNSKNKLYTEIGNIGPYNTLSNKSLNLLVVTPYNEIKQENSNLLVTNDLNQFINDVDQLSLLMTLISHDITYNKSLLLLFSKVILAQSDVIIGVFGLKSDKNKSQKIEELQLLQLQMSQYLIDNNYFIKNNSLFEGIPLIFDQKEQEMDNQYINILVTNPYVKKLMYQKRI